MGLSGGGSSSVGLRGTGVGSGGFMDRVSRMVGSIGWWDLRCGGA